MDYSLVLISRNRPAFLARLLRYYARHGLRAPLHLGDASDAPQWEEVQALAREHGRALDLRLTHYGAGVPPMPRLAEEYAKVETPLVAWVADDDFLAPPALAAGARALGERPAAAAFAGRAALFSVKGDGAHGTLQWFSGYPQRGYAGAGAAARMLEYARDPVPLAYALRRTALSRSIMATVGAAGWPDDAVGYAFFEILDGMLTVVGGEVLMANEVLMVRQSHVTSYGAQGLAEQFDFRYLSSPAWASLRDAMVEALVRALAAAEPTLGQDAAREAAERALWLRTSQMWRNLALRSAPAAAGAPARPSRLDRLPFARAAYVNLKMLSAAGAAGYGALAEVKRLVEQGGNQA